MNESLYKINPVKAVTNLGYAKRDIIGPSNKCYSICAAFSSGDDPYRVDPECAKQCDQFVEKRRREVYGVGKCDHQAPYRPVIWDNIPMLVPKFVKKGNSPEEALQLAKDMCKNVPNLCNECVDLAELHYNAIEKINSDSKGMTGPNGLTGFNTANTPNTANGSSDASPVAARPSNPPKGPTETFNIPEIKENYKNRSDNSILMCTTFMFLIIFIVLMVLVHSKIIII
jgi:hypothetical protein